jgi:HAMP domain-containing protein
VSLLIVLGVVVLLAAGWVARRLRRRRRGAEQTMIVATFPEIELTQSYGGWNADAYDARTGHGPPATRSAWTWGPPSTWGRLP